MEIITAHLLKNEMIAYFTRACKMHHKNCKIIILFALINVIEIVKTINATVPTLNSINAIMLA
jgi:hypothetical protein